MMAHDSAPTRSRSWEALRCAWWSLLVPMIRDIDGVSSHSMNAASRWSSKRAELYVPQLKENNSKYLSRVISSFEDYRRDDEVQRRLGWDERKPHFQVSRMSHVRWVGGSHQSRTAFWVIHSCLLESCCIIVGFFFLIQAKGSFRGFSSTVHRSILPWNHHCVDQLMPGRSSEVDNHS